MPRQFQVRIFLFYNKVSQVEPLSAPRSSRETLTCRSREATMLIAPATMHRMKLFGKRISNWRKQCEGGNLRFVDGCHDDAKDRVPCLFAGSSEKAARCSRESVLNLVIRNFRQQRSKVAESKIGEDRATDRKTGRDAKELCEEDEGDAIGHVFHFDDAKDHGEARLQVAANANTQENLEAV